MKTDNFKYLKEEFPILLNIAEAAEASLYNDSPNTLIKLRLFAEKLTLLIFEKSYLELPYDNTFFNQLRLLQNEGLIPERIGSLIDTIRLKGNKAVHEGIGTLDEAKTSLFSAFKIAKWFYETFADGVEDIQTLKFSIPQEFDSREALQLLEEKYQILHEKFEKLSAEREVKSSAVEHRQILADRAAKAAKKVEYSEAETRLIIDKQLRDAGWEADTENLNYKKNKTLPEVKRSIAIAEWPCGKLWADYALFIGTKLVGIVEAKKYVNDISSDLSQAKTYSKQADVLADISLVGQWQEFKTPFVFSTNGRPYLEQLKTKSGIWFQDVRNEYNRPRPLHGWLSPDGINTLLEQNVQVATKKLEDSDLDYLKSKNGLGLREYQINAIKAVESRISENTENRRALLTMATGTGKTRTILGLAYRLIKANRFKRILFLVDRNLLATQTFNTFNDTKVEDFNSFLDTYKASKLSELVPDYESRLHFATVQGMVKRLFYAANGAEVLPVDTYDCIIVDEAHRGYLQDKEMDDEEINFKDQRDYVSKYRKVLDYFDAFGVGLTATPALHTTAIFGKSVFNYSYREAVIDGYLIDHDPPHLIQTKLNQEGITWNAGVKPKVYDPENNEIIELEELEDELSIDVSGFNRKVITEPFNRTVAQQLVQELDPESDKKTLIFAATDQHADLVVELLQEEFEKIGANAPIDSILKITGRSHNPQELVRRFKNEKYPSIVVTVDLLTTGVDVPSICNIVFLRQLKSRILYEQMLGRATRRCDKIGKETFQIYDAVCIYDNLADYTTMKPVVVNQKTSFSQLVDELDDIKSEQRIKKQLEQIIAKFQRKRKLIDPENLKFVYYSNDIEPDDFVDFIKNTPLQNASEQLKSMSPFWKYLDELQGEPTKPFFSDHADEFRGILRGYGKGQEPHDYLEGFKKFIAENQNKLTALQVICTRPKELDRKSLKQLLWQLDNEGYTAPSLNAAWKATTNQDIAADIISFIRTLALGNDLVDHEERVKRAVDNVRKMRTWNVVQLKWLDRFEKQLLKEHVLQVADLNSDPFSSEGGFDRLNKVFENQLDTIIENINTQLYTETA